MSAESSFLQRRESPERILQESLQCQGLDRSFPKSLAPCTAPGFPRGLLSSRSLQSESPHRALGKARDTVCRHKFWLVAKEKRAAFSVPLCGVTWVAVLWIPRVCPGCVSSIPAHPKGVCGKGLDSALEATPSHQPARWAKCTGS